MSTTSSHGTPSDEGAAPDRRTAVASQVLDSAPLPLPGPVPKSLRSQVAALRSRHQAEHAAMAQSGRTQRSAELQRLQSEVAAHLQAAARQRLSDSAARLEQNRQQRAARQQSIQKIRSWVG